MSENAVRVALRSMGYGNDETTAHGFRGMASTRLNEMGWAPDVIERQLAHLEANRERVLVDAGHVLRGGQEQDCQARESKARGSSRTLPDIRGLVLSPKFCRIDTGLAQDSENPADFEIASGMDRYNKRDVGSPLPDPGKPPRLQKPDQLVRREYGQFRAHRTSSRTS